MAWLCCLPVGQASPSASSLHSTPFSFNRPDGGPLRGRDRRFESGSLQRGVSNEPCGCLDDPATEKPGSAENRDEPAMAGCVVCKVFCHDAQACLPARFGLSSQGGKAAPQHAAAFLLVNEQPGRLRDGYRASS